MKIVIVGGGTAGWIAATILNKYQLDEKDITVISSDEIEILGVGESTTAFFSSLIATNFFGLDRYDFFKKTDATQKHAVRLKNWSTKNREFYSPIDGSVTASQPVDFAVTNAILNDEPLYYTSKCAYLCENNLTDVYKTSTSGNMICENIHAVHIDTYKTGKYFKDFCTSKLGVKHINDTVLDVVVDDRGFISKLKLKSGVEVEGDFFIDASGFAKVLTNKLDVKFVSSKEELPVNSAISFVEDLNDSVRPETKATALSSGWMWEIPTRKRMGMGYTFCDNYITFDQAFEELEQLGHKPEKYKLHKFEGGRLESFWNKNCLSIGVCGSFIEPLQATSIHTTIAKLLFFAENYLAVSTKENICTEIFQKKYNEQMTTMVDDFMDLVSLHYSGGKTDSPFWSDVKIRPKTQDIIELAQNRVLFPTDLPNYFGAAGYDVWYYLLAGLGHISKKVLMNCRKGFFLDEKIEEVAKQVCIPLKEDMRNWSQNFLTTDEFNQYLT